MIQIYDVFRNVENGEVLWLTAAETLEEAHDHVATALAHAPGSSFTIVNQRTGERHFVPPGSSRAT